MQLRKPKHYVAIALLSGFFVAGLAVAGDKYLYKYRDENGRVVIKDVIPPELATKGYTVLSTTGRVVKEVKPALTEEEIAQLKAEEQASIEAQQQAVEDARLLRDYSGVRDAERARDRKLEALDVRISIDRGIIKRLENEFEEEQQNAASAERLGRAVSDDLIASMERLDRQIQDAYQSIELLEKEKQQVRDKYGILIKRLEELTSSR